MANFSKKNLLEPPYVGDKDSGIKLWHSEFE